MPIETIHETVAHFGASEALVTLISGHVRYYHGLQITDYGTVRLIVLGGENDHCWLTEIADIQPAT